MTQGLARVISIGEVKISNDIDQPVLITPGTYEAVMSDWKVNYNGYFRRHILINAFSDCRHGTISWCDFACMVQCERIKE